MDFLGILFFLVFLLILILSTFFFKRELTKNKIIDSKYILIFFSMCIISLSISIIICYYLENYILIDLFEIEINHVYNEDRIITFFIVLILNSILNFVLFKIYLKKFYLKEKKRKNEIELIGKQ